MDADNQTLDTAIVMRAARVVEDTFPPIDAKSTYCIVVSLNLLNAAVKETWGKLVTSYAYIKGMAACLFLHLLFNPVDGVEIFWNGRERLTFFRVSGRQFSFHYVPLLELFKDYISRAGLAELHWDGVRRQFIAAGLFTEAVGNRACMSDDTVRSLRKLMVTFCKRKLVRRVKRVLEGTGVCYPRKRKLTLPYTVSAGRHSPKTAAGIPVAGDTFQRHQRSRMSIVNSIECLRTVLDFWGLDADSYVLSRHGDNWKTGVARFTGTNTDEVADVVAGRMPTAFRLPGYLLKRGKQYYLKRNTWRWAKMSLSRYLLLVAHYNNLQYGEKRCNLCITYGLACYIAALYPELRFINVLNFTRFKVHRRLYTYSALIAVRPHSKSRTLKVWMVVDVRHKLKNLDLGSIPEQLLREYAFAPNYNDFFRTFGPRGHMGLRAYSWWILLAPVYDLIVVYGHYARVRDGSGKWAVYSLMKESFSTDFVYDSIWFDSASYAVCGKRNGSTDILHKM